MSSISKYLPLPIETIDEDSVIIYNDDIDDNNNPIIIFNDYRHDYCENNHEGILYITTNESGNIIFKCCSECEGTTFTMEWYLSLSIYHCALFGMLIGFIFCHENVSTSTKKNIKIRYNYIRKIRMKIFTIILHQFNEWVKLQSIVTFFTLSFFIKN